MTKIFIKELKIQGILINSLLSAHIQRVALILFKI